MQHTQRKLKNRPTSDVRDDAKPVVIHLVNDDTIHAADHETRNGWVIVYRFTTTGIDKKVPRESVLFIDRVNDDGDDEPSRNGGEDSW
ncbi:hypothetical protein ACFQJ7_12845 [Halovenus rubra]|uniref:Uncharacterized protein n=2 Tax=Halovenus rubra TaxID=869890 RepID=A0ACC7E3B5_9EURY|nr:hypothetical protein [Halovenus rubra]